MAASFDDEVVALGLGRYGRIDRRIEQMVRLACAKWGPQVGGILLAEAHIKSAGAGDPHAVASLAEIVGEGGDEAERAACIGDAHIARRAARPIGDVLQGEMVLKTSPHERERQILLGAVCPGLAHRHGLDQGQAETSAMCPAQKRLDLVLVHAPERDRIDLDLDAGPVGGTTCQRDTVLGRTSDVFTVTFYSGSTGYVVLSGDGVTDLDLFVYDQNGNLIDADTDSTDQCIVSVKPLWTGQFTIVVVNNGYVYNDYTICVG